jgi:ureidoacrylate peracid hydrolase
MATNGALSPKETAFVLIEYQNDFVDAKGNLHGAVKGVMEKTNMLDNTVKVVEEARKRGCTIIHCPIKFSADYRELIQPAYGILKGVIDTKSFIDGTWGAEICGAMKPHQDDLHVETKRYLDGFHNTNLNDLLQKKLIKNVVVSGFLTNCCVDSTMRTAYEKVWRVLTKYEGYHVVTLTDCVATGSEEEQKIEIEKVYPMFSHPMTSKSLLEKLA